MKPPCSRTRCLLPGEEGDASPHPVLLSLHVPVRTISPAGFTRLCRSSRHWGGWKGRDTPWGKRATSGHVLWSLTPQTDPFAVPVGLQGLTDTSATIGGSCDPDHIRQWDKGSSNNTNSIVKINTGKYQTQRDLSASSWNNGCLGKLDSRIVLITSVSTL